MNNNNILFLLGAGASYETGFPLASELFDTLLNDLQNKNHSWYELVQYLKNITNNSFEDAISTLEFISSQNYSDYELELISHITGINISIDKKKLDDIYHLVDYIKRVWINNTFKVNDNNKINHLLSFVELANNLNSAIFTLNYDNSLEIACEKTNIDYSIGLSKDTNSLGTKTYSLDNYNSDLNIYKLHGSVDLYISEICPDMLFNNVFRYSEEQLQNKNINILDKPAIILGSKNKLTSEAMYLDLLYIFKENLKSAKQIYIIGYSFGDPHINKFIQETYYNYPNKTFCIVDPYLKEDNEELSRSFIGGSYTKRGKVDYRNIFMSSENLQNNNLLRGKLCFSEFIKKLNNNN